MCIFSKKDREILESFKKSKRIETDEEKEIILHASRLGLIKSGIRFIDGRVVASAHLTKLGNAFLSLCK